MTEPNRYDVNTDNEVAAVVDAAEETYDLTEQQSAAMSTAVREVADLVDRGELDDAYVVAYTFEAEEARVIDLDVIISDARQQYPSEVENRAPQNPSTPGSRPRMPDPSRTTRREPAAGEVPGAVQAFHNQREVVPPLRGA